MGLIGPLSHLAPVEDSIMHVVLLIGLAVGVDYALFYLRRVREERAAGRDKEAAIDAAAATSGRAVLVSGFTVMIAMAGMYLAGAPTFTSFATGTIVVVAVAMIGSLTVLPAVLSVLGDRVDKGRVPGLGRLRERVARIGIWSRIVDRVLRRPLLSAVLATGLLVAMALPALQLDMGTPSTSASLPQDEPVVQTFNRVQKAFPAETQTLSVVVKARTSRRPRSPRVWRSSRRPPPSTSRCSPGRTRRSASARTRPWPRWTWRSPATAPTRSRARPWTCSGTRSSRPRIGSVEGVESYVDGQTAQDRDFTDTLKSHAPLVFAFVLSAAFLLLLVTFRSIVVPIKAIMLNLLSVGAAYGAMVLVFQHGWFKGLLGFTVTGPIESWVPMFMFVVLFGLSMDYHVFILSRVREAYDKGMKTEDAVSYAVKNTAGVVTSAAVVMVAVFAIFGSLSFIMFKQMGLGLAFAVLLDATLIRGVLLPATMKLLGDRNWWLPKKLDWLPQVRHEGEVEPAPVAA